MSVATIARQDPGWLPPRVALEQDAWGVEYMWQDFGLPAELVRGLGLSLTFLVLLFGWLALRLARQGRRRAAEHARLLVGVACLSLAPLYAEADDGDGDTMGFAFVWAFPGFILLASAPTTRRLMRRPIGWLLTAALFLGVVYLQWMQPYFWSLSDAWFAAPWMLTWFAFTLGSPKGRPLEGAWDRATSLVVWGLMLSAGFTLLLGDIDEAAAWDTAILTILIWCYAGLLALFAMVEAVLPWNLRAVFFPEHPALHDWKRDQPER